MGSLNFSRNSFIILLSVLLCLPFYGKAEIVSDMPDLPTDTIVVSLVEALVEEELTVDTLAAVPVNPNRIPGEYRFRPTQIILPAALVTVGAFGVNNGFFKQINNSVKDGMADIRKGHYVRIDDWFQYSTPAAFLTLGFIPGVKSHNGFKGRILAGTTAYAIMSLTTNILKYTVREKRPDSSKRNSFPSGHTATVFTGAELMRLEYGNVVGIAGYGVALGVAFLRLYNERHWLNDVIAGAGIGILSARAAYWLLPLEKKLFRIRDDSKMQMEVLPVIDPTTGSGAVSMNFTF